MTESVAVVGVGAMGAAVARRLHAAGIAVTVVDRDELRCRELVAEGCATASQAGECSADVVLVLVATPDQVHDVVDGPRGLIAAARRAGRRPRIVLMSTIPADVAVDLHRRAAATGIRVIDAPISGGVLRADDGTLAVMAGGEPSDVDAVRPILDHLATQVFHCGPIGSGATVKIINNVVGTTAAFLTAESTRLALECGLDLDRVLPVLDAGSGRTFLTAEAGEVPVFFDRVAHTPRDFDSLLAIIRKDLGLAGDLAGSVAGEYPLLERLRAFAADVDDATYRNWRAVAGASGAAS